MSLKKPLSAIALALILSSLTFFMWQQRDKLMLLNPSHSLSTLVSDKRIRIGAKDFTENLIVAEIYALAMEDAGYEVERLPNISSSLIHTALINQEIDLYPEYTGTGLLSILKKDLETDPAKVYELVKAGYRDQFQVTWLDYAPANDSQGLVIRTEVAKELNIKTISDLQKHAKQLRFASQGEFDQRKDGMLGLIRHYGEFDWLSSKVYDNSLKYIVLANKEADVTPAYTTEGQLVNSEQFTVLEDDKQFWPPYNLAPLVRTPVLEKHPELAPLLNKISQELDTKGLTALNAKVDVDGQEYTDVARDFYKLIKKEKGSK